MMHVLRPRWLRRAAAGGIAAGFCATLPSVPALVSTSCDGHECDSSSYEYGCASVDAAATNASCCTGCMLPYNTWASTPLGAEWLPFGANATIRLELAGWIGDRVPDPSNVEIMIAPGNGPSNPTPATGSWPGDAASIETVATGDLGEFGNVGRGEIDVTNGTCSPAWARITVRLPPQADGGLDMTWPCWKQRQVFCDAGP